MTLSGGESLCQPEFCTALLRGAKELGITTALESMACADYSVIEKILPYLDQYLMDIKHTDPQKHKEFTAERADSPLAHAEKKYGIQFLPHETGGAGFYAAKLRKGGRA